MNDFYDEPGAPAPTAAQLPPEPVTESEESKSTLQTDKEPDVAAGSEPSESPAATRFKSCRWHEKPDSGPTYCGNRDVLPFAGKNDFNSEAWCPDCKLYKVKRKAKKRPVNEYDDY